MRIICEDCHHMFESSDERQKNAKLAKWHMNIAVSSVETI